MGMSVTQSGNPMGVPGPGAAPGQVDPSLMFASAVQSGGCGGGTPTPPLGTPTALFNTLAGTDQSLNPQELFGGLTSYSSQNGMPQSFDANEATQLLNAAGVNNADAARIFGALAGQDGNLALTDLLDVAFGRINPQTGMWNFDEFGEVLGDVVAAGQPPEQGCA